MAETVLVVGDHHSVRKALCKWLAMTFPEYQVIEVANSPEVEAMVISASPCLVVVDIGPLAAKQLDVIRRIKAVQPLTKIVGWSVHDWETYQSDALAAGATAYVLKENTQDKLLAVLTTML